MANRYFPHRHPPTKLPFQLKRMVEREVIIIGGGPAGASCARYLKQHNIDCLILDQTSFPRTKTCAGWITPEVWEDLDIAPSNYPYGLSTFNSFQISIGKLQFKLRVKQYAIRRVEFDDWLLHQSGVHYELHKVKKIAQVGNKYVVDDQYTSQYLIGAGGTYCPVYQSFFSKIYPRVKESLVVAMETEIPFAYSDDRCQLWFMENNLPGYAWYVPKANGYINIGIGGNVEKLNSNGKTLMNHWDHLIEKMNAAGIIKYHSFEPKGHMYYLRQKHPMVRKENALIVGDAVGLATLDMGEGIRAAIKSGILAAKAIINNTDYSVESIPKYSLFSLIGF
jgi:flavin-dependent dehydrogenase